MNDLQKLHDKLNQHLEEQAKNWKSFIYAKQIGFYQGFDEIEIEYLYHALKEVYGDDKVQLIYKDENYTPAVVRVPTKSHEDDGGYIAVPEDIIK